MTDRKEGDYAVEITATVLKETDDAVLIDDGAKQVWLPKQLIEMEKDGPSQLYVILLPEWLAMKEELA